MRQREPEDGGALRRRPTRGHAGHGIVGEIDRVVVMVVGRGRVREAHVGVCLRRPIMAMATAVVCIGMVVHMPGQMHMGAAGMVRHIGMSAAWHGSSAKK